MNLPEYFILGLVFAAVAGSALALAQIFMPRREQARMRQVVGAPAAAAESAQDTGAWQERMVEALSPAGRLTLPAEGWQNSPFRQRFAHAGYRGEKTPIVFFGVKSILTFGLPVLFMLAAGLSRVPLTLNATLVAMLGLAAVGYYAPNAYLKWKIARRQREIFEAFPDALDLLTVAVEAGLGLDAAIERVGREIGLRSIDLEEEIRLLGLELRAGAGRAQALRNLALRTGVEEVDLLVTMLIQSDRFGTSVADSLRVHSDSLRTKRRLRAEEAAAKIPLKLLFPLIFCIFPAIMIVLLGPAVISIYRAFVHVVNAG